MTHPYGRIKAACFINSVSMAVVTNITPLLLLTFRELYDISYSLLGFLVLVNFCTQLAVDLIFSFFSHKFNIPFMVKSIPVVTTVGLVIYALLPYFFPSYAFLGLLVGTVIFSMGGGLTEVLTSPTVAAIPSENPDREMSRLHSMYAWGVVGMVLLSTGFLAIFGRDLWPVLVLLFALLPLSIFFFSIGAAVPVMESEQKVGGVKGYLKSGLLWLCFFAMFCGGAAECTMGQWCSGYIEGALGISKVWGDIFGMAAFSLALGLGRTLYAKRGKQIERVLTLGSLGATVCYVTAAVFPSPIVGLAACAITGLCTAMMWPGCLIVVAKKFPAAGVFIYAAMAAGGDFGAAAGPQMIGAVTDAVAASSFMGDVALRLSLTPDSLGMRVGMLLGALFPLGAFVLYRFLSKENGSTQP
ncbi:MAG: MFS transporter [Clostridia bacterium]|nr:MFS transporter [Clostridia bacterium]MBO7170103.1 MFS transporter [Clostridia bacterium]